MAAKKIYDPYTEALNKLNKKNVDYVVIGMSGINYYASKARETFSTQDFDIFVKPAVNNIKKTISIFEKLEYSLIANKNRIEKKDVIAIVRNKNTILATDPYGINFELILAVSGYTFSQMQKDAVIFSVNNVPVKVAKLRKLLMSKKAAGREKDKLFLKRYEILLKEKKQAERKK